MSLAFGRENQPRGKQKSDLLNHKKLETPSSEREKEETSFSREPWLFSTLLNRSAPGERAGQVRSRQVFFLQTEKFIFRHLPLFDCGLKVKEEGASLKTFLPSFLPSFLTYTLCLNSSHARDRTTP